MTIQNAAFTDDCNCVGLAQFMTSDADWWLLLFTMNGNWK